jgi:phosphatidylinositol glycan class W
VRTVLRETCVLLALGCARLLSLPATDYQQHASEYGAHCNFFFVLAFTKVRFSGTAIAD